MRHKITYCYYVVCIFCTLLFLSGCSGAKEPPGLCSSCYEVGIMSGLCPCCSSRLCESCYKDAKRFFANEYETGFEHGQVGGYDVGYDEGYRSGHSSGMDYAAEDYYAYGYEDGYADALEEK